jgi:hypothetical protein
MANELLAHAAPGQTLYLLLFNATGQVYKAGAFEAPVDANWTSYPIALTEAETTGIYRATMPAVAAGAYRYAVRAQAGASPATSDATVGTGSIRWTGTAEEGVPAQVDLVKWKGQTPNNLRTGDVQAYLFDRSIDGLRGVSGIASITFPDLTIQPGDLGGNTIHLGDYGGMLFHDNALVGWTVLIEDGNSGISYASPIVSSNYAARTITMAHAMPPAQEWMVDPIPVMVVPFAISSLYGSRTVTWTYALTSELDGAPIPQARIEVYTDETMTYLVAQGYTDNFGQVTFYLDPGTYYLRRTKAGWSFTNPDTEIVEEPSP